MTKNFFLSLLLSVSGSLSIAIYADEIDAEIPAFADLFEEDKSLADITDIVKELPQREPDLFQQERKGTISWTRECCHRAIIDILYSTKEIPKLRQVELRKMFLEHTNNIRELREQITLPPSSTIEIFLDGLLQIASFKHYEFVKKEEGFWVVKEIPCEDLITIKNPEATLIHEHPSLSYGDRFIIKILFEKEKGRSTTYRYVITDNTFLNGRIIRHEFERTNIMRTKREIERAMSSPEAIDALKFFDEMVTAPPAKRRAS